VVICTNESRDSIFLNDIFPCDGIICEGQWTGADQAATAILEPCNLSINTNAAAGCYTFTRSSDGTGSSNQCGAFVQTLNIEIIEVAEITVAIDVSAPACGSALTATTNAANIKWQSTTTSAGADDFVDVPGQTGTTLITSTLTETTYFRAVVVSDNSAGTGACSGGACELPSNVITLAPVDCSDVPMPCLGNPGDIGGTAFLDVENDGVKTGNTGQTGIIVRAYDCDGNEVAGSPTTTDANGDWTITGLMVGDTFRVEFTIPTDGSLNYLVPSFAGADNGTNVQFVSPDDSDCEVLG